MINGKLHTASTDPIHLYILAGDLAYFKLHFFSADHPSDLANVKAAEILRFPNDKGILFNHIFGKTLRSGDSRVFAVARHPNPAICPVKALDDYISICTAIKISVHSGPLSKVTTSCSGRNSVPKFDCIDCDLLNNSSPDLVKRLRLFFLPVLLLAMNKPVMRTSKYKRFNEQNNDLTRA